MRSGEKRMITVAKSGDVTLSKMLTAVGTCPKAAILGLEGINNITCRSMKLFVP